MIRALSNLYGNSFDEIRQSNAPTTHLNTTPLHLTDPLRNGNLSKKSLCRIKSLFEGLTPSDIPLFYILPLSYITSL